MSTEVQETSSHLFFEIGKALASSAVGVHQVKKQAKFPFDLWIDSLAGLEVEEFENHLRQVLEQHEGFTWKRREGNPTYKRIPLRLRHRALWFTFGKTSIRIPAMNPDQQAMVQSLIGL